VSNVTDNSQKELQMTQSCLLQNNMKRKQAGRPSVVGCK